ncbi:MAG: hypothetical protein KBF42_02650 [Chitinophagales bacterium]|jgi:hypothetical protein|nr:hypothetical protein [Bacteroidota bacterium]MBP8916236.1 hypothetical protein [Chitinophagales bacterium]MBP9220256.1 hypothetical protein [Chitinophagales bacterium]MBP9794875.1 hypothetical protein [Chitinophagales bacterium]
MTTILKKGASKKELQQLNFILGQQKNKKGIDTNKYCGIINFNADALEIQKKLRFEWR